MVVCRCVFVPVCRFIFYSWAYDAGGTVQASVDLYVATLVCFVFFRTQRTDGAIQQLCRCLSLSVLTCFFFHSLSAQTLLHKLLSVCLFLCVSVRVCCCRTERLPAINRIKSYELTPQSRDPCVFCAANDPPG